MSKLDSLAFTLGKIAILFEALMLEGIYLLFSPYMDKDYLLTIETQKSSCWNLFYVSDNFASIITNQILAMGYMMMAILGSSLIRFILISL